MQLITWRVVECAALILFSAIAAAAQEKTTPPVNAEQAAVTAAIASPTGEQDSPRERSLELSEQSASHYFRGDYRGAMSLLTQAYEIFPEPVLLYNMGRTAERLGETETALQAYRRYLAAEPQAENRSAVEGRISELQASSEPHGQTPPHNSSSVTAAHPAPKPPSESTRNRGVSLWPVTVAAAGGALLATSAVLWSEARTRHADAIDDPEAMSAQALEESAKHLTRLTNVTLVTGATLFGAGIAWGIVDVLSGPHSNIAIEIGPGKLATLGRF
jgi:tetratricopeptide (TPR) repeat protein